MSDNERRPPRFDTLDWILIIFGALMLFAVLWVAAIVCYFVMFPWQMG